MIITAGSSNDGSGSVVTEKCYFSIVEEWAIYGPVSERKYGAWGEFRRCHSGDSQAMCTVSRDSTARYWRDS